MHTLDMFEKYNKSRQFYHLKIKNLQITDMLSNIKKMKTYPAWLCHC